MEIHNKIWQKKHESPKWFTEEIVYFDKNKNKWITEAWKYTKNESGDIEEVILKEEQQYPRGSKLIIERKFPWLHNRKNWNIKYQPEKY